ncbi:MAG: hypothetical protein KC636_30530 [Myxococcales bacterium]|nr:hypothetical protein [Myxococcales bacterium]
MHNTYGALLLIDVTFTSNDADSVGGGWSNHNTAGTVTAGAVTYANNSAGSGDYEDCYDVNGGCAQ